MTFGAQQSTNKERNIKHNQHTMTINQGNYTARVLLHYTSHVMPHISSYQQEIQANNPTIHQANNQNLIHSNPPPKSTSNHVPKYHQIPQQSASSCASIGSRRKTCDVRIIGAI
eukprot:983984_1